MKHPFPIRRTDTITRANVLLALQEHSDKLLTLEDVALYFLRKENYVKERHVRRARRVWPK